MPIVFNVKIAICLIFTANTRLSFHQQSPVTMCTPPLLSRACTRTRTVGAPAVSSYASEAKRKRNKIHHVGRLIVNETT